MPILSMSLVYNQLNYASYKISHIVGRCIKFMMFMFFFQPTSTNRVKNPRPGSWSATAPTSWSSPHSAALLSPAWLPPPRRLPRGARRSPSPAGRAARRHTPTKRAQRGQDGDGMVRMGRDAFFFLHIFSSFFFVMLSYAGVSRWGNWWNLWMGQISDFFGGHDGRWEMIRSTKMGRFLEREFRTKSFNMKFKRW